MMWTENKEKIAQEIEDLAVYRELCYQRAREVDLRIQKLSDKLHDRCPEFDGILRCELKEGHTGDHFAEYMGS